jgi:hypothetical protein
MQRERVPNQSQNVPKQDRAKPNSSIRQVVGQSDFLFQWIRSVFNELKVRLT